MRKRLLFVLFGFLLIAALLLGACDKAAPSATTTTQAATTKPVGTTTAAPTSLPTTVTTPASDKYGGVVKAAFTVGPPLPIGYPSEGSGNSYTFAAPALETLIRVTRDGKIVPILAESWDFSQDNKSLLLHLRKGVKFHDGSDFNASVCKWNLDLIIAAKKTTDWTSVDVVDDYTIRLNFPSYKNSILTNLATGVTLQVSKASFDKNGIEWARWNPVGTGPFIFVEYKRDSKMTFKKNTNYWQQGKPYLDGVEWDIIADATVRELAFKKGDLSFLSVAALSAQNLQKEGYEMASEQAGTLLLMPCSAVKSSPWANVNVRLAASYALNREALRASLGFGFAKEAYQIYPSFAQTALPDLIPTKQDTAKAKQLLKEAGYPSGFKTVMHVFKQVIPPTHPTAIAPMLQAVGIDVTVDNPEAGKYATYYTSGWDDGLLLHAIIDSRNYAGGLTSYFGHPVNFTSIQTPAGWQAGVDAMQASKEPDPKLIQNVIRLMVDDMTVIPYLEETRVQFYQKGVHDPGAQNYSLASFISEEAWLDKNLRK